MHWGMMTVISSKSFLGLTCTGGAVVRYEIMKMVLTSAHAFAETVKIIKYDETMFFIANLNLPYTFQQHSTHGAKNADRILRNRRFYRN